MRFLIFLLPVFIFAYTDLGRAGFDYPILEENFLDVIKKGVEELDIEAMKDEVKRQLIVQATGENNLSVCQNENVVKEFDYTILPETIFTPTGKVYKEKGTKITSYLAIPMDICFVDGTNKHILKNQIEFFDKETKGKCTYMISNANILDIYKEYPNRDRDMYPSKKQYEDRFNVKCNPTRVHLIHNDRIKYEYSVEKFKTGEEK